jgi:hypothetical protein
MRLWLTVGEDRHRLTVEENRRGGKISGFVRAAKATGWMNRQDLVDAAWLVANAGKGPDRYEGKVERLLAEMKRDDVAGFFFLLWRLLHRRRR